MILGVGALGGGRFVEVVAGGAYPSWCDRCMSSSAVRIGYYVLTLDGPRRCGLWWACMCCDPERFEGWGDGDGDDDGDGDVLAPV